MKIESVPPWTRSPAELAARLLEVWNAAVSETIRLSAGKKRTLRKRKRPITKKGEE